MKTNEEIMSDWIKVEGYEYLNYAYIVTKNYGNIETGWGGTQDEYDIELALRRNPDLRLLL